MQEYQNIQTLEKLIQKNVEMLKSIKKSTEKEKKGKRRTRFRKLKRGKNITYMQEYQNIQI